MLLKALDRVEADEVAVVDTPPGNERVLAKAIEKADSRHDPHADRRGRDRSGRSGARTRAQQDAGRLGDLLRRTYTRDYQDVVGGVGGGERAGVGEHPGARGDRVPASRCSSSPRRWRGRH